MDYSLSYEHGTIKNWLDKDCDTLRDLTVWIGVFNHLSLI